jgi:hypothetical protein
VGSGLNSSEEEKEVMLLAGCVLTYIDAVVVVVAAAVLMASASMCGVFGATTLLSRTKACLHLLRPPVSGLMQPA